MSGALAGRIGTRLPLWRPDPARDAIGSASGGWIAAGLIWARPIHDGGGRWRIVLRTPSAIAPGWRAGDLIVTEVIADPALPDRLLVRAEERR